MKKKKKFYLSLFVLTPIVLCASLYLALALYYGNGFSFGTWVNGIYCTGKTVDVINQELLDNSKSGQLHILLRDGTMEVLELSEIGYREDYAVPLEQLHSRQNQFLWGRNLFLNNKQVLLPQMSFDETLLEKRLGDFPFMQMNALVSQPRVEITASPKGYELFDNTRFIVDGEKVFAKISNAIMEGSQYVELDDGICYAEPEITAGMQETYVLWEQVKAFQDFRLSYIFGDTAEVLDSAIIADWIRLEQDGSFALDESGQLILEEAMIKEYIASLASKYDTIGGKREFQATRGEVVTIEGGTYGNQLNQKAETEYLLNAFLAHNQADRVPEYTKSARQQGADDIGGTYVEVDMGRQIMYYYEEGELQLETPIVTGNTALKRGTPERVCYVYAKQKNRILRGPGYASHVNFWMPVNGGIGIHDAKWRSKFGGEIYKDGGSHGCINTPYDIMVKFFDMVDIGTPVVMFY